ncbi:hypothetical protein [Haloarchaeobius sp. HRN-SO-5]|uniref:hypothetical protein n=1 Tax=Haloarchaeobius sp. HRN-SO-5 TaxID=3446118 RepID=UPI003EBAE0A2
MGYSLSHLSDEATQETNVTGTRTPILTVQPEDGTMLSLINRVAKGDEIGIPLIMALKNAADGYLPPDTSLLITVKRPTDDSPIPVAQATGDIAAWNSLSTKEQRNEENIDEVKVELLGEKINVRPEDVLRFELLSSEQVDWANSELYVYRKAVETGGV